MGNLLPCLPCGGLVPNQFDPKEQVDSSWGQLHRRGQDSNARVNKPAFIEHCKQFAPDNMSNQKAAAYAKFVGSMFETGVAMMLPNKKHDLGKHGFGYASLLCAEFYGDNPADRLQLAGPGRPKDAFKGLRAELDKDWARVEKDSDDRVTLDAFTEYFLKKYANRPCMKNDTGIAAFKTFLAQNFESSCAMMLPEHKSTLGGHGFRYAGLMTGEYYFEGSGRDALMVTTVSERT